VSDALLTSEQLRRTGRAPGAAVRAAASEFVRVTKHGAHKSGAGEVARPSAVIGPAIGRVCEHTVPVPTSVGPRSAAALAAERREIVRQRSRVIAQHEQWFVDAEVRATRRDLLGLARRRTQMPSLGFSRSGLSVDRRPCTGRSSTRRSA
jgi:hypothetical protein